MTHFQYVSYALFMWFWVGILLSDVKHPFLRQICHMSNHKNAVSQKLLVLESCNMAQNVRNGHFPIS